MTVIVLFHKSFQKSYRRLPRAVQEKADERIALFVTSPSHPSLNVRPLRGDRSEYFSINITGDYRALYQDIGNGTVKFYEIGTHSELYR